MPNLPNILSESELEQLSEKEKPEYLELLKLRDLAASAYNAESSLSGFISEAWPVIEPTTEYSHNWHIDAISERLEAMKNGRTRRLIINIPPRCGKSLLVSVMWPVWTWTSDPGKRFIFASYSGSLSMKHSVDRRTLISSPWYQKRWGHKVRLSSDQNVKTEFSNTARGHMIATSVGGTVTGKGGDFIVVDDPHSPEQAYSETERETAIRFFDQTLVSRLDDQKTGGIVVIMQRLHILDLTGHLLGRGGWEHLCFPMESE